MEASALDVVLGDGKIALAQDGVKIKVKIDAYVGSIKMHIMDVAGTILGNDCCEGSD